MFAAGSGIAPFRGFLKHLIDKKLKNKAYLFLTVKDRSAVWYKKEVEYWLNNCSLSFFMTCSQDNAIYVVQEENGAKVLVEKAATKSRVDGLIKQEPIKKLLSSLMLLDSSGTKRGHFFICGQAGFASMVQDSLLNILDTTQDSHDFIAKLVGQNRYHLSVFTSYIDPRTLTSEFDPSEIVLHNNKKNGYWIVVNHLVYDITHYLNLHPGGPITLTNQTGLDATREYEAIGHHLDGGINSLLSTYCIGKIRSLNFGLGNGCVGLLDARYTYLSLEEFYNRWLFDLYLVVEMYNTVYNMFDHYEVITSSWTETQEELIFYKIQATADDHLNFICHYFSCIISRLTALWALTASICYADKDMLYLKDQFDIIKESVAYKTTVTLDAFLLNKIKIIDRSTPMTTDDYQNYNTLLNTIRQNDIHFLKEIKYELREGIILFEKFSATILLHGRINLLMHLDNTLNITRSYLNNMNTLYNKLK